MEIKFVVMGDPKGKQRPRVCRINGRSVTYTPKQTIEYEGLVKARCVAAQANSHTEFNADLKFSDLRLSKENKHGANTAVSKIFFEKGIPLEVKITAYFAIPKRISKNTKKLMLEGKILPTKKPDGDNIIKIILDALNGEVYKDDAQICKIYFEKKYADISCVKIEIKDIMED